MPKRFPPFHWPFTTQIWTHGFINEDGDIVPETRHYIYRGLFRDRVHTEPVDRGLEPPGCVEMTKAGCSCACHAEA